MALKLNIQGYLIYAAMLSYLVAFVALSLRAKRYGAVSHVIGFVLAVAAVLYRWYDARHVPLQSMLEVFLFLGMLPYPISVLCRRFLGTGGTAFDALIGLIILFPAGFVFKGEPQKLFVKGEYGNNYD